MNRRALTPIATLTALAALVPALSGCQAVDSVVDYFGPRPDETLVALARSADNDAQNLADVDANASSLRADQADALYAEVKPLCGLNNEGNAPRSCTVERTTDAPLSDVDVAKTLNAAAHRTRDALSEVSSESRALVTNQAIVLDAWDGAELPAIPELEAADLESATSLLNWEYEQVFGLDFARSYASPEIEADIDNRLSLHEKRIEVLQGAIGEVAKVPQPAVAYQPTAVAGVALPTDASSAQSYVDKLGWNDTLKWEDAASKAAAPTAEGEERVAWRNWLIAVAAQSRGL